MINGAKLRLRPIILTTITTVVAVMPMIYGWGGKDEIIAPIAMTLGYGLLGASFLTLFAVPCLIMFYKDFHNLMQKWKRKIKEKIITKIKSFKKSDTPKNIQTTI